MKAFRMNEQQRQQENFKSHMARQITNDITYYTNSCIVSDNELLCLRGERWHVPTAINLTKSCSEELNIDWDTIVTPQQGQWLVLPHVISSSNWQCTEGTPYNSSTDLQVSWNASGTSLRVQELGKQSIYCPACLRLITAYRFCTLNHKASPPTTSHKILQTVHIQITHKCDLYIYTRTHTHIYITVLCLHTEYR